MQWEISFKFFAFGNKVCQVYITLHFIRGEKGWRGVWGMSVM